MVGTDRIVSLQATVLFGTLTCFQRHDPHLPSLRSATIRPVSRSHGGILHSSSTLEIGAEDEYNFPQKS